MKPIHRCVLVFAALLGLTLTAGRVPAAEPPLADRVPADALVYVGWTGLDSPASGYADSKLAKLAKATDLRATLGRWIDRGLKPGSGLNKGARAMLGALKEADGAYLDRPWALYIQRPKGMGTPHQIPPVMRFMIVPGKKRARIAKAMKKLRDRVAADVGDHAVGLQLGRGHRVMSFTFNPDSAPPPDAPRLAGSDRFAAAMHGLKPGSLYTSYVNVADAVADAKQAPEAAYIIKRLGLDHLRALVQTGGFDDRGRFITHLALRSDGKPVRLLRLLGGQPIGDADLKLAPKSAMWVRAIRLDLGGLFEELDTLGRRVTRIGRPNAPRGAAGAQGAGIFDEPLDKASAALGEDIDLRRDLIHGIGSAWVLYADPSLGSSMFGVNIGAAVSLDKPKRIAAVLAAAMKWFKAHQPTSGRQRVEFSRQTLRGIDVYAVTSPQVNIALGVHGGRLYITAQPRAVPAMANQASADDSVLDNPAFEKVRAKVGMKNPTTLVFVDLAKTAPGYYGGIRMLLGMAAMAADSPQLAWFNNHLPPLSTLQGQLSPAGWASRVTPTGWTQRSVVPFPAAIVLSPEAGTVLGPGGPAFLYPSFMQARQASRQVTALSRLNQLSICWIMSASDHDQKLPGSLSAFLPYLGSSDTEMFFYPGHEQPLPADWKTMSQAKHARWLRIHSSWVYLSSGHSMGDIKSPSSHILLFARPKFAGSGKNIPVAYADGHAVVIPIARLRSKLKKQTGKDLDQLVAEH